MLYRTNSSISVEYPTFGIASACGKAKKKDKKKTELERKQQQQKQQQQIQQQQQQQQHVPAMTNLKATAVSRSVKITLIRSFKSSVPSEKTISPVAHNAPTTRQTLTTKKPG